MAVEETINLPSRDWWIWKALETHRGRRWGRGTAGRDEGIQDVAAVLAARQGMSGFRCGLEWYSNLVNWERKLRAASQPVSSRKTSPGSFIHSSTRSITTRRYIEFEIKNLIT